MKQTYKVIGMSCDGCKEHVQDTLNKIDGVKEAQVDLNKGEAVITTIKHIPTDKLKKAFEGSQYSIHEPGEHIDAENKIFNSSEVGMYQCPMKCEGDKTYHEPGNCPVCNMKLVKTDN